MEYQLGSCIMWTRLFIFIFVAINAVDATRVVCYYTNWAQYRPGKGKYVPENVDPSMCTHVMYAFATISHQRVIPFEGNDDSTKWHKGMYERMMSHKVKNPHLKILLSLGGYNMKTALFSQVARTQKARADFAQSTVGFLRARHFDGLDMDWEYPTRRGGSPQDKRNFVLLMQELMKAFKKEATRHKPRLLLTGAFAAGKINIDAAYDLKALVRTMDFINVMAYDFHGSWEKRTGFNNPLYKNPNETGDQVFLNVDWVARYYVSKGVPKDKLVIGLATYGRSFTLDSTRKSGVHAPASLPGQHGRFTRTKGFLAYYEVCELLSKGAKVFHDKFQISSYAVKGRQWVGFDDVEDIKVKACYVNHNRYGGIMFWSLDLDDFTGQMCGQGRYPLMNAAIAEYTNTTLPNCKRRPDGSHHPTTTPAPGRPHPPGQEICAGKQSGYEVDPDNCHKFYQCSNGTAYHMSCPGDLAFNPKIDNCDYKRNVPGCH